MRLSKKNKWIFGISGVGKDAAYALSTIMFIYLTTYVGMSAGFVGGMFMVVRIWDAVNDPIMGNLVHNTKSRWGKFRPWILEKALLQPEDLTLEDRLSILLLESDFLQIYYLHKTPLLFESFYSFMFSSILSTIYKLSKSTLNISELSPTIGPSKVFKSCCLDLSTANLVNFLSFANNDK